MEGNFKSLNKSVYIPFDSVKNYYLYSTAEGGVRYLQYVNGAGSYTLEIKPNGYKPKTGLLLAKSIENKIRGKKVLDLCTGETGVIAIHSASYGAKEVVGVDVDKETVDWANYNADLNNLRNISFKTGNLFENVTGRFEVIIANPPQMPMVDESLHDSGGIYGREIIEKIIVNAPKYLLPNGEVYMLLFDFLAVDKCYTQLPSIKQIFEKYGFSMQIIKRVKRLVRKGGETEKSLKYIMEKYPSYSFESDGEEYYHEVFIVRAVLGN